MKYWVIADTHFGHDKMKEYCGRPDGFEIKTLKNIKSLVGEEDVLIHLGDFCIGQDSYWHKMFMDVCKSKKWLIRGNHDRKSLTWYQNVGWDFVGDFVGLERYNKKILFSHKPTQFGQDFLNIHGHCHNTFHHSQFVHIKENAVLVMLEHSYKPFRLKTIVERYGKSFIKGDNDGR